jgi:hypothetical protein
VTRTLGTALALLLVLAPAASARVTPMQVVREFRAHGLEAAKPRRMTRDDYGFAPYVGQGVRFLIPSLGENRGGRVFSGRLGELRRLKAYYDDLGEGSAILFSWTYLNRRARILVQINGELSHAKWLKYRAVVRGLS